MLNLSNYLVQSSFLFLGVGTPFPYLFLALQPWV